MMLVLLESNFVESGMDPSLICRVVFIEMIPLKTRVLCACIYACIVHTYIDGGICRS